MGKRPIIKRIDIQNGKGWKGEVEDLYCIPYNTHICILHTNRVKVFVVFVVVVVVVV